mmetsp:Transcript_61597/g.190769  ORF Transcript_61597/g.190769 Transcript_61597/m.190769 type:complete len:282 (-) Transcript_61597:152-997(-)
MEARLHNALEVLLPRGELAHLPDHVSRGCPALLEGFVPQHLAHGPGKRSVQSFSLAWSFSLALLPSRPRSLHVHANVRDRVPPQGADQGVSVFLAKLVELEPRRAVTIHALPHRGQGLRDAVATVEDPQDLAQPGKAVGRQPDALLVRPVPQDAAHGPGEFGQAVWQAWPSSALSYTLVPAAAPASPAAPHIGAVLRTCLAPHLLGPWAPAPPPPHAAVGSLAAEAEERRRRQACSMAGRRRRRGRLWRRLGWRDGPSGGRDGPPRGQAAANGSHRARRAP